MYYFREEKIREGGVTVLYTQNLEIQFKGEGVKERAIGSRRERGRQREEEGIKERERASRRGRGLLGQREGEGVKER